ncbi:MAG: nicotinamide mononucleotide transporter family protein [Gammaproteobacteria bacterium]|nr:nicotinamide mononucleotide transporter family protein [Gammaproteobacteria bacterium]
METFFAPLLSGSLLEFAGLVAGLVCVWLLIRQNIWTWPVGILYVLISLWIFLQARLYADLALHVVFLVLNCYGWCVPGPAAVGRTWTRPIPSAPPRTG